MFKTTILIYSIIMTSYSIIFIKKLPDCSQNTGNLINLFTLMCTNIANGTNNTLRDACIGCFQSAATANNNQPSLPQVSTCAVNYLTNTNYSNCITSAQGAATNAEVTNQCVTGYCGFVRCIRGVNADILIANCYLEASTINNVTYPNEQVNFYKNITSCILAIARCSSVNPITGEDQTNKITYNKWGKPVVTNLRLYNTLQITPSGELRIVAFPTTSTVQKFFCSTSTNLQDSSWRNYTC